MPHLLIFALTGALLTACAGTTPVEEPVPTAAPVVQQEAPAKQELPERPFPDDSVYPLLVAEFALRRREYDIALDNYMTQSRVLRDAGISAHTTHLTQFMRREREALEASELWVELEPDNAEAQNTYATLLVRQGRTLEAVPHMAEVQRLGEEARFPALLSNFDQLDKQQQAELVKGINELAEEWPDNTRLLLTQALILAEFEQYPQSLQKLDKLFTIEPYQPQALLLEVRVLIAQGEKKPFTRLERALQENPDNQQLRLQYARLLTASDMAAAREQFEILSAQSPRDGDLLLSLALINREIGDDLAAKAYLKQMLGLQQRVDEAHFWLGRIAEDEGEMQTAISHYMQVGGESEFLSASNRIGQILIGSGQYQQAREIFVLQRRAHPEEAEALYGLEADLFTRSGEQDQAMDVLNEALQQFPQSNTLLYARSMLAEQLGDLAMMERDLRDIIERDPDNATALNALGYTLANRTQRYGEAYELITRALELQPDEPAILDSMGWILYRKGRYEEAVGYLTRAYTEFPDPEVAAHLGEVLWVSGETEAATTVWQGALMKDPEHKVLLETLERLGVDSLRTPLEAPSPTAEP
ncbi:MAG: tetratricopeptide repeat protein [Haliea sp.]|jgi:tetratricopeptide (TPR) repeat protein|nr:tetratricopeptide repeat protein [Haliea sp.]